LIPGEIRKPDFFIVGAPKCGTTAMDDYLRQHPEVFMAVEKESHFFAPDFYGPQSRFRKEEDYLSLFQSACDEKVVGESSVGYLYSEMAAAGIKAFNPDARIIIMLRNPVEMIYAYHSELLFQGFEEIENFEEALALESQRKQGLCLPKARYVAKPLLCYRELGKFGSYLERFFSLFGRRNVHVIIFDEFKRDTARVYCATCAFLGVSTDFQPNWRPSASVINSNRRTRSLSLSRYLRKQQRGAVRYVKAIVPRTLRRSIARQLWSFNIKYEARPPMSLELKQRLSAEFAPDVERLSQMLGHDLTFWSRS
jgi:sulfotransferase family protein